MSTADGKIRGYSSGTVYLVNGPYTGTGTISSVVDATVSSTSTISMALDGDVDGDGADDLLLGRPSSSVVQGFFGPLAGSFSLSTSADLSISSTGYLGSSVAFVGDQDGDGADDFACGQYGDDIGGTDAGAVHLFFNADL